MKGIKGKKVILDDNLEVVLEVEKVDFTDHKSRINGIVYYQKKDIIITCSEDFTVKKWSTKCGEFEFVADIFNQSVNGMKGERMVHGCDIYCIEKWDEKTVLCGFGHSSKCIRAISIEPPYRILKTFNVGAGVYQMLSFSSNDLFVYCDSDGSVNVFSYSKGKINMCLGSIFSRYSIRCLVLSLVYPKQPDKHCKHPCIYVNCDRVGGKVLLLQRRKTLNTFNSHNSLVNSIEVMRDKSNPSFENILLGTDHSRVCIYQSRHTRDEPEKNLLVKEITILDRIFSLCLFDDSNYLIIGGGIGRMCIYDVLCGYLVASNRQVHKTSNTIREIVSLKNTGDPNICKFASICYDSDIQIFNVSGLTLRTTNDSLEQSDLKERIEFLMCNVDEYFFNEDEKKSSLFSIKLGNFEVNDLCKTFFL